MIPPNPFQPAPWMNRPPAMNSFGDLQNFLQSLRGYFPHNQQMPALPQPQAGYQQGIPQQLASHFNPPMQMGGYQPPQMQPQRPAQLPMQAMGSQTNGMPYGLGMAQGNTTLPQQLLNRFPR